MTLEQTTQRILRAVEAQDLEALTTSAEQRRSAIAMLRSMPASPGLRDAVAASIAAGEAATRVIRIIRQRMRKDSGRLTQIKDGFLHGSLPAATPQIDCKG
jgi:hypothetical protein